MSKNNTYKESGVKIKRIREKQSVYSDINNKPFHLKGNKRTLAPSSRTNYQVVKDRKKNFDNGLEYMMKNYNNTLKNLVNR